MVLLEQTALHLEQVLRVADVSLYVLRHADFGVMMPGNTFIQVLSTGSLSSHWYSVTLPV